VNDVIEVDVNIESRAQTGVICLPHRRVLRQRYPSQRVQRLAVSGRFGGLCQGHPCL